MIARNQTTLESIALKTFIELLMLILLFHFSYSVCQPDSSLICACKMDSNLLLNNIWYSFSCIKYHILSKTVISNFS